MRFQFVTAIISVLKSCFIRDPRQLVRYWRQKVSPALRPSAARASVLIIIQFARTDFVTISHGMVLHSPRSSNRGNVLFRYNEYPSSHFPFSAAAYSISAGYY